MKGHTEVANAKVHSRRRFIMKLLAINAMMAWFLRFLSGCGGSSEKKEGTDTLTEGSCQDLSSLSEQELKVREGFAYVDESPDSTSSCENCNLWLPPEKGRECGGCMLFKGPVVAKGHCTYWVPLA